MDSRRYVGRRGAVWPLGRPVRAVGCGAVVWASFVVLLGLAFFSLGGMVPQNAFSAEHAPLAWLLVGVASLAWPAAYLWGGWFRTLFGYWPAPGEGDGVGPPCETCGSTVRRGHTQHGHYVCDECAMQRALDNRRLIVPPVVLVGISFAANGLGTLLQVRAAQAGTAAGGLLGLAPLTVQERWHDTFGLMGVVGGLGLTLAGGYMLVRVIRAMVLPPISGRALTTVRAQIGAALDRESAPPVQPSVTP